MGVLKLSILLLLMTQNTINCITITTHEKAPSEEISETTEEPITEKIENATIVIAKSTNGERQRRLIPYTSYYLSNENPSIQYNVLSSSQKIPQHNYQSGRYKLVPIPNPYRLTKQNPTQLTPIKYSPIEQFSVVKTYQPQPQRASSINNFTPFTENNKLQGGFTPMIHQNTPSIAQQYQTNSAPQYHTNSVPPTPNFSTIYDQLLQYKQLSQLNSVPQYVPSPPPQNYKNPIAQKPVAVTYENYKNPIAQKPAAVTYENYFIHNNYKNRFPQTGYVGLEKEERPRFKPYIPTKTVIQTYQPGNIEVSNYKTVVTPSPIYETYIPVKSYHPKPAPIKSSEHVYRIPADYSHSHHTTSVQSNTDYSSHNSPVQSNYYPSNIGALIKNLQKTNTIPQTLTQNNVGTSIKTLVNFLNALKQQNQQNSRPQNVIREPAPVYQDEDEGEDEEILEDEVENSKDSDIINVQEPEIEQHEPEVIQHAVNEGTTTQVFPAQTTDGGTPGKAGIDYPALYEIPETNFDCKTQRYKGFFGDPETNCQVWHYCDLNGGQASFLCPNGTIFSQVALTCDWWYNVKCASTAQLYVLNERLYKFILPVKPKFPEDYSGPIVDQYLTQKFREMEEKMRRQKQGKGNLKQKDEKEEEDNEETLQGLQNANEIQDRADDEKDFTTTEKIE